MSIEKQISDSSIPQKIGRDFGLTKLHGDASARSYYRVTTQDRTYMLMVLPANQPTSLAEEITKVKTPILKLPFLEIQEHLLRKNVRVPEIIDVDLDHYLILLEDFGDDLLLSTVTQDRNKIEPLYKLALQELRKISTITDQDPKDSIAFSREFDRDLYNWEFIHFVEYGLDHQIKNLKGTDRARIVSEFETISEKYESWPKVLCHRDYHSRNVVVVSPTEVGIIDFQDMLLAPPYYDLVSLLKDSYIDLGRVMQEKLAFYYKDQMGNNQSKDEFLYCFDLMSLQRNLKAAGRFAYFDIVKKNPNYLKDIPRTLGYVKITLEAHSELKTLRNELTPYLDTLIEKFA